MRDFQSQLITDEAQVGTARRAVERYARGLGFTDDELAEIAIVVQEIGTNAARYASEGGHLHWTTTPGDARGLELFYCDKGPGIHDFERAARDGVSSGGGLGAGLGAVRRLLDEFDAYSTVRGLTRRLPGSRRTTHGTAILGRKWPASARHRAEGEVQKLMRRRLGVCSRPRPGEDTNGDAYFVAEGDGQTLYAVIDGLGHGAGARKAADAALGALEGWDGQPLDEVVWSVHEALRSTRGAVIGAVVLDRERGTFTYAGVGNVDVRVLGAAEAARPIPSNGTLGARLSQVRVWPHRWAEGTSIVMASDGLSTSWDIESYPGLLKQSPQLLAGILLRDYGRDSDDATVLVIR
jgi:anti-sigma regulatory factor (Ser/Thr protein kinase)